MYRGSRPRFSNRSHQSDWRHPAKESSPSEHQQPKQHFSGEFVKIDPNAKFLDDEQVKGIHLVTDFNLVREIQVRLGELSKGPTNFFPVMWPVSLSTETIKLLTWNPYEVAPRVNGPRYLLYVDPSGKIFLENMTQHIFYVDDDHAIEVFSSVTDTILDGVFTREKSSSTETNGKLTFVIEDAIRCGGVDLTELKIRKRFTLIQEEIMNARFGKGAYQKEAFNIDIVDLKEFRSAEDYLCDSFENSFKYPLRCFLFFPRDKGYVCGTCPDVYQWAEKSLQTCSFRLKIPKECNQKREEAELYIVSFNRIETFFATIALTDEIRELDGRIIDCQHVDGHWVFDKLRNDRQHPNGRGTILNKFYVLKNPVARHQVLTALKEAKENVC